MAERFEGVQTRFMTVGEVAAVLRVSSMTVYRLINSGDLPAVRIGRSFRLRPEDLDRYLADRFTKAG
jgi:excisionase family DNA binding protein